MRLCLWEVERASGMGRSGTHPHPWIGRNCRHGAGQSVGAVKLLDDHANRQPSALVFEFVKGRKHHAYVLSRSRSILALD